MNYFLNDTILKALTIVGLVCIIPNIVLAAKMYAIVTKTRRWRKNPKVGDVVFWYTRDGYCFGTIISLNSAKTKAYVSSYVNLSFTSYFTKDISDLYIGRKP